MKYLKKLFLKIVKQNNFIKTSYFNKQIKVCDECILSSRGDPWSFFPGASSCEPVSSWCFMVSVTHSKFYSLTELQFLK